MQCVDSSATTSYMTYFLILRIIGFGQLLYIAIYAIFFTADDLFM